MSGKVSGDTDDPEAILESLSAHIHLVSAKVDAELEVVLIVDVIEGVPEREDVGSTLERREAAIAEGPIAALELRRNQSATVGAGKAFVANAAKVGVGNAASDG